jgi:capsular polysaccharide biosynthesis protein
MEELNLKEVFMVLKGKWWVLVICVVVMFSLAYFWTNYYVTPLYSAETTLYVGKNIDQEGLQTTDLNMGTNLIEDYREIAKSRLVAYEVMEELGITGIDADTLAEKIKVVQRGETRVIQISVEDADPRKALEITRTVAEVFRKKVIQIMQLENVQIIDRAEMPLLPVSPQKSRNYMLGIMLGAAIGAGIIFLIYFLDDNIKTPEDIRKCVELPVIGTIPAFRIKGRRYEHA